MLRECEICNRKIPEDEGFECQDCGRFVCLSHGDSDMCFECIGDEIFLADILGFEE